MRCNAIDREIKYCCTGIVLYVLYCIQWNDIIISYLLLILFQ